MVVNEVHFAGAAPPSLPHHTLYYTQGSVTNAWGTAIFVHNSVGGPIPDPWKVGSPSAVRPSSL